MKPQPHSPQYPDRIPPLTDDEIRLGFAASCIEAAAKALGCSYRDVYRRMKRVGLIQRYARQLDPVHTQSREYVTREVIETLQELEAKAEEGGTPC